MRALIGYTGFVGGVLREQQHFDALFNSFNISDIGRNRYSTVVCAAAPGSMVIANRNPAEDGKRIDELIETLKKVHCDRFILISSIAVLSDLAGGVDERTESYQTEFAYGRHRRRLEAFVESSFANPIVVRLPALFGKGLRKNFLFDLMNPTPSMLDEAAFVALKDAASNGLLQCAKEVYKFNQITEMWVLDRCKLNVHDLRVPFGALLSELRLDAVRFHNPLSTLQFYNMSRLSSDLAVVNSANVRRIHLAPEPLKLSDVYRRLMGVKMPVSEARQHHERMKTMYSHLWNRGDGFIEDSAVVIDQISSFYDEWVQRD